MAIHSILFYLLLILLPVQLGYHWWPQWTYILGRRIDYYSPTLFFTDIIFFGIILSWTYSNYSKFNTKYFKNIFRNNRHWEFIKKFIYFLALSIFVAVNIYLSQNKPVAIYKWVKVFEFLSLAYYVFATKPDGFLATFSLSLAAFYSSVLALLQFLLSHSVGSLLWFLGERSFTLNTPGIARMVLCFTQPWGCILVLRPYGTFPHPNVLGGFLSVVLILLVYTVLHNKVQPLRLKNIKISKNVVLTYILITIALGLGGLVLTFSRGAIMALIAGLLLISGTVRRKRIIALYFQSGLLTKVTILLFVAASLFFLVYIFISGFDLQNESIKERLSLGISAFAMWKSSPLAGIGLGNFLQVLPSFTISRSVSFLQPVHSIFLLLLTETGIMGFILFVSILIRVLKNHNQGKLLILSLNPYQISVAAILIIGFFDHYPLTLQQGQLLFAIVTALSLIKQ